MRVLATRHFFFTRFIMCQTLWQTYCISFHVKLTANLQSMCYFCFIEVERSSVGSEGVKMLWLTRDWNPSSLLLKLGFITAQIQHYSEEFFHLETTFQVLLTVVGKSVLTYAFSLRGNKTT